MIKLSVKNPLKDHGLVHDLAFKDHRFMRVIQQQYSRQNKWIYWMRIAQSIDKINHKL